MRDPNPYELQACTEEPTQDRWPTRRGKYRISPVAVFFAVAYLLLFYFSLRIAFASQKAAGGGMGFIYPAILGLPWSIVSVWLWKMASPIEAWSPVGPYHHTMAVVLPGVLNLLLILFLGRRRK